MPHQESASVFRAAKNRRISVKGPGTPPWIGFVLDLAALSSTRLIVIVIYVYCNNIKVYN